MAAFAQWTRSPLTLLVAAVAFLAAAIGGLSGAQPRLGILAAIGITFVALVFADLLIGFAAMVMFAFLEALSSLGGVSLAKVAGVLLVVAWLAVVSSGGVRSRNFFAERPGLTYLLLAFLGWNAVSVVWSASSGEAASSVMRYTLNAILVPVAFTAIRARRDVVRILAVVVVGATIAAISAILVPPDATAAAAGRATGTIGDPNELAAALVVGLAIAGAFAVNRFVNPLLRLASAVAAALCMFGILVSLSRGGLLGVGAALIVAVVMGGRWRARVLAACATLALVAVGYFAFVASLPAKERVLNVGGGTGRLDLWTVATRMIDAHPFRGVGSGQFASSSVHYLLQPGAIQRGDLILSTPKVAHNTYLNILAELGFVGGALFAAVALTCLGSACFAVQRLRQDGDEQLEILVRGVVVGICGYLVTLLFISENYSKLFWILMAFGPVLLAVSRVPQEERAETEAARLRALRLSAAP